MKNTEHEEEYVEPSSLELIETSVDTIERKVSNIEYFLRRGEDDQYETLYDKTATLVKLLSSIKGWLIRIAFILIIIIIALLTK